MQNNIKLCDNFIAPDTNPLKGSRIFGLDICKVSTMDLYYNNNILLTKDKLSPI
jgi:hypothetical protein